MNTEEFGCFQPDQASASEVAALPPSPLLMHCGQACFRAALVGGGLWMLMLLPALEPVPADPSDIVLPREIDLAREGAWQRLPALPVNPLVNCPDFPHDLCHCPARACLQGSAQLSCLCNCTDLPCLPQPPIKMAHWQNTLQSRKTRRRERSRKVLCVCCTYRARVVGVRHTVFFFLLNFYIDLAC